MAKLSRRDLFPLLCVALLAVSCGPDVHVPAAPGQSAIAAFEGQAVVREILGQIDDPPGARGRRLTLVRYTIAPGAELAPHVHPGVQMASVTSGILTYRVISGIATIHRQVDASGLPTDVEELVGPADTELHAGDAVIEDASMTHFGSNRTSDPVVILATLITAPDEGLSVPAPIAE